MNRQIVKIADIKIACSEGILVTLGLGSCVALAIHDGHARCGSLAHIMLPRKAFGVRRENENMNKYADVAIETSIQLLEENECSRGEMVAKIAGGAHMFDSIREGVDIGSRNVDTIREILESLKIPLVASDTGGRRGRTIEFDVATGEFRVKTVRGNVQVL